MCSGNNKKLSIYYVLKLFYITLDLLVKVFQREQVATSTNIIMNNICFHNSGNIYFLIYILEACAENFQLHPATY